jgi:Chaperone of endosialidase
MSKKMENSNGDFKVNGSLDVNQNLQVNGNSFIFGGLEISGPFKIAGPLSVKQVVDTQALRIIDVNGDLFPDNWIGMASNIDGTTKWLHVGGITDSGARRLALIADRTFISGNLGIGTTQPLSARLEIQHNSWLNSTHIAIRETEAGDFARISLQHLTAKAWHIAGRSDINPMFNIWHSDIGNVMELYAPEKRVSINPNWKLTFGNQVRQMIDLWSTEYGIGVQSATLYFRSWDAFYWYKGGIHDDNRGINSGGGREMMSLQGDGRLLLTNGTGSIGVVSDIQFKKNIKPLDKALDKLTKLRGVTFQWKEPELRGGDDGVQTGLIAQEVEQVFPDWVREYGAHKSIAMPGFEALLIESLKELKSEIQKIKSHLNI